jgi:hypothetical protein
MGEQVWEIFEKAATKADDGTWSFNGGGADDTVRHLGLDYTARAVPLTDGQLPDIDAFIGSAWNGAYSLIQELRRQDDSCAAHGEKVVLVGYSQGAWVIHATLQYLYARDSELLDNLVAVGYLSDPLRSTSADAGIMYAGTAKPEGSGLGSSKGFARVGIPNAVLSFHDWQRGLFESLIAAQGDVDNISLSGGSYPPSISTSTISLCDNQDIVCGWSFDQANSISVHESYSSDSFSEIAEFLLNEL